MAGEDYEGVSIEEVLGEILDLYPETLSFTSVGPETIPEIVETLTVAAVAINLLAIHEFGGRLGPQRSKGLVEQVVGAAFQTYEGVDPHPDPFDKAAMLLRGITQGHPFSDGNKRTGFMLAAYYLHQMGYERPPMEKEDIVAFCLGISAGVIRDVHEMANRLATFWKQPYPRSTDF